MARIGAEIIARAVSRAVVKVKEFFEDLEALVVPITLFVFVQANLQHEHREGEFALECLGAGVASFWERRRNEELFEGVPNGSRKVGHLVGLVLIVVVLVLGRRVSNRFLKKSISIFFRNKGNPLTIKKMIVI